MMIIAINYCHMHRRLTQCPRGQQAAEARADDYHMRQRGRWSLFSCFFRIRQNISRCHRFLLLYILHSDSSQDTSIPDYASLILLYIQKIAQIVEACKCEEGGLFHLPVSLYWSCANKEGEHHR